MGRLATMFGTIVFAAILLFASSPAAAQGPFTRLQVLLPGESAAPGTGSGKTGTALAQISGIPFTITVRACDAQWNTVQTVGDAIEILTTNPNATLPPNAQLQNGTRTFTVTFNNSGNFTVFAHDLTDGTIPDGASSSVTTQVLQTFSFSNIDPHEEVGRPFRVTITARTPTISVATGFRGNVALSQITSFGPGRMTPTAVTFTNGTWTGDLTVYRADETNQPRGSVYVQADYGSSPTVRGTSEAFRAHRGSFSRLQILVPGQQPLPGSITGWTGSPAAQIAGRSFTANVQATDAYWNELSGPEDRVEVSSSDGAANTPQTLQLSQGFRSFNIILNTVGSRTLTVRDVTNGAHTGMTTPGIPVVPSSAHHFVISAISSPQTAGVPVDVTIRATDQSGNTVPNFAGDANLVANTGAGSITPDLVSFENGVWTGQIVFRGSGNLVQFTCSDFAAPPHVGTSNSFVVNPGPLARLQVLVPGEQARGGTLDGKEGTPTVQNAGIPFSLTVRAVDAYWNLVTTNFDRVALGSTDAFAIMPAETTLANGQRVVSVQLHRTGPQRIWASDVDQPAVGADTSSAFTVIGGTFSRILVLAPGESVAPGTATGRTGTATDESINYAFTCTVLATDQWWNPVTGVNDVIQMTCDDPGATLPPNTAMVDGRAEMSLRLARGGYNQISVADVTRPSITGSSTQVRAISTGFHLEVAVSPATARAGEPFTLDVRVTNDAGSVIQEINSFITVEVRNATDQSAGRGELHSTQFQLLQGQRTVTETYTFAEPIVIVARDDAGNAPGISNAIVITPGQPSAIEMVSDPVWLTGNKHATIRARLVDDYANGVPDQPIRFQLMSGTGTLTAIDSVTAADGGATADFLSPRVPEQDVIRAISGLVQAELTVETALVDPTAGGGTITNYPNPFHPPQQPTSIVYKLDDNATVKIRIFSQSGSLVREQNFTTGDLGGRLGINAWDWDGRNGNGDVVASGGYTALIEAEGNGATLHVMRRRIAVVR